MRMDRHAIKRCIQCRGVGHVGAGLKRQWGLIVTFPGRIERYGLPVYIHTVRICQGSPLQHWQARQWRRENGYE